MLGTARSTPLSGLYDAALVAVRRNPIPVALIAAGLGWLAYRTSSDAQRRAVILRAERSAERLPVTRTGTARIYDPDHSTARPVVDAAGTQTSARL